MAKKTTKKTESALYTVTVKNMGKTCTGKGKTVLDALSSVDLPGIGGTTVVVVENTETGDSKERVLSLLKARRCFKTMGLVREVQLKNLSLMFDNV